MPSKLAVQMYTLRQYTTTRADFAAALRRVAAIGYPAVQLSAVGCMNGDRPEVDAPTARKMLEDHGLLCIATHRGWQALAADTEREIAFHQALGCTFAAIGGLGDPYRKAGAQGFRDWLRDAGPVVAKLKAAGITFGYHNHSWELVRCAPGPRTLLDIVVDEGGPDLALELDVCWLAHGGANPAKWLARCAGRVPVIHAKDLEVDLEKGPRMAACGDGNLDWHGILAAGFHAGVRWYAVEQDDCFGRDPFDCLAASYEYLSRLGA